MRKTTAVWIGLALAATLVVAGPDAHGRQEPDWAHGERPGVEEHGARRMERMIGFLDLNEQQIEEWQALHEGQSEAAQGKREEMRALHTQIEELVGSDSANPATIGNLVLEAHALRGSQEAAREALHAELMAVLTPEQQGRFEAMKELHPRRGGRGRRPRFGDFGPRGDSEND